MNTPIDPREFGRLEAEVQNLQTQVTDLQTDVKTLLELANRGKGTFYGAMTLASGSGAFVMWLVENFSRRTP